MKIIAHIRLMNRQNELTFELNFCKKKSPRKRNIQGWAKLNLRATKLCNFFTTLPEKGRVGEIFSDFSPPPLSLENDKKFPPPPNNFTPSWIFSPSRVIRKCTDDGQRVKTIINLLQNQFLEHCQRKRKVLGNLAR